MVAPPNTRNEIAVDLLRRLDPTRLLLYGGRRPEADDWARHCHQGSDYVLVATRAVGAQRQMVGTLEYRVLAGADGEWAMIDRLYVDPRYRRLGIASRLIGGAIGLARERGIAALREHIPNVLVRDPDTGRWYPHLPTGEGWGGLRSLGATVAACIRAGQPCAIARASRSGRVQRTASLATDELIGAILCLPIAGAADASLPMRHGVSSRTALLNGLIDDLAVIAGVRLAHEASAMTTRVVVGTVDALGNAASESAVYAANARFTAR